MFPTAYSNIYRNESGEVIGWDNDYDYEPDPDDFYDSWGDEPESWCKRCGEEGHESEDCPSYDEDGEDYGFLAAVAAEDVAGLDMEPDTDWPTD